jgi:tRNA threonylcarbamoyladenosine biosynthesis protein TsaB
MLILAFDTTSEVGGVGIFRDAERLALIPSDGSTDRYSITLFEMVEKALDEARLKLSDIELFAAANGPGSFTGIRVGLAAALAWGRAFERPVRGISVLEAMVATAESGIRNPEFAGSFGTAAPNWYIPVLDARRGEFFVGSFRKKTHAAAPSAFDYETADDGWILKPDALRSSLEERAANGASATCQVRSHDRAAVEFCSNLPPSVNFRLVEGVLVGAIAAIAAKEEAFGQLSSARTLDAYYIRRPDAEVKLMND